MKERNAGDPYNTIKQKVKSTTVISLRFHFRKVWRLGSKVKFQRDNHNCSVSQLKSIFKVNV